MEVKGANTLPAGCHAAPAGHPKCISWAVEQFWSGCGCQEEVPSAPLMQAGIASSSPADTEEPRLSTPPAPAAGRGAGSAVSLLLVNWGLAGRDGASCPSTGHVQSPKCLESFWFVPCNGTARCELVATPGSSSSKVVAAGWSLLQQACTRMHPFPRCLPRAPSRSFLTEKVQLMFLPSNPGRKAALSQSSSPRARCVNK